MMVLVRSLGLFIAPALLSVSTADFSFAPAEDLEVKVEFKQSYFLELTSFSINDEEIGNGEIEFSVKDEEQTNYTDVFVNAGGDRPTLVHRTFDELTKQSLKREVGPDGEELESEDPAVSELEGKTVAFTWDADEEEYVASYAEDEEGDEDLLEDIKFAGYLWDALPSGEVEEGDRWEIDASFFDVISEPCGDLGYVFESKKDDEPDDDWGDQFAENLDGEFFVEYAGTREEDGVKVAVFVLTAEVTTEVVKEEEIEGEGFSGTSTTTFSFDFDTEGELLWNIEKNMPYSLTFAGDVEFEIEEAGEISGEFGEMSQTSVQSFEGRVEIETAYN